MYFHLPLCSPCPWDKILHCKTSVFLNVKKYQNHPNVTQDHTLADARSNIALEISYFIKPQWISLFNKSEWISFPEIQWWIWWNFQNLSLIYYFFPCWHICTIYWNSYVCVPAITLSFFFLNLTFKGASSVWSNIVNKRKIKWIWWIVAKSLHRFLISGA